MEATLAPPHGERTGFVAPNSLIGTKKLFSLEGCFPAWGSYCVFYSTLTENVGKQMPSLDLYSGSVWQD